MKIYYITFILIIAGYGCKPSITYKGNIDLIGNWEGKTVEITSPSSERISFPMSKYGFSSLTLNKDSSFNFVMEIMRDIILDKDVFGNSYSKVMLKSGFKNYRSGYFLASASKINSL